MPFLKTPRFLNPGPGKTAGWKKKALVTGIMLAVALAQVIGVGNRPGGLLFNLYYSYFSDVALPFGMYFLVLLSLEKIPGSSFKDWRASAGLVFGAASGAELLQAFGVPLLGSTFDPLDFLMYGAGVLLAALVERTVFARLLPWWEPGTAAAGAAPR